MFDVRWVEDQGMMQLQWRSRSPLADASGAICGFGEWSEWQAVRVVHSKEAVTSSVDVFPTKANQG